MPKATRDVGSIVERRGSIKAPLSISSRSPPTIEGSTSARPPSPGVPRPDKVVIADELNSPSNSHSSSVHDTSAPQQSVKDYGTPTRTTPEASYSSRGARSPTPNVSVPSPSTPSAVLPPPIVSTSTLDPDGSSATKDYTSVSNDERESGRSHHCGARSVSEKPLLKAAQDGAFSEGEDGDALAGLLGLSEDPGHLIMKKKVGRRWETSLLDVSGFSPAGRQAIQSRGQRDRQKAFIEIDQHENKYDSFLWLAPIDHCEQCTKSHWRCRLALLTESGRARNQIVGKVCEGCQHHQCSFRDYTFVNPGNSGHLETLRERARLKMDAGQSYWDWLIAINSARKKPKSGVMMTAIPDLDESTDPTDVSHPPLDSPLLSHPRTATDTPASPLEPSTPSKQVDDADPAGLDFDGYTPPLDAGIPLPPSLDAASSRSTSPKPLSPPLIPSKKGSGRKSPLAVPLVSNRSGPSASFSVVPPSITPAVNLAIIPGADLGESTTIATNAAPSTGKRGRLPEEHVFTVTPLDPDDPDRIIYTVSIDEWVIFRNIDSVFIATHLAGHTESVGLSDDRSLVAPPRTPFPLRPSSLDVRNSGITRITRLSQGLLTSLRASQETIRKVLSDQEAVKVRKPPQDENESDDSLEGSSTSTKRQKSQSELRRGRRKKTRKKLGDKKAEEKEPEEYWLPPYIYRPSKPCDDCVAHGKGGNCVFYHVPQPRGPAASSSHAHDSPRGDKLDVELPPCGYCLKKGIPCRFDGKPFFVQVLP